MDAADVNHTDPGSAPGPVWTEVDAIVRATFDSAPDGLVVLNASGWQVAFNSAFLAMWDFPPAMVLRRDTAEMRDFVASQLLDQQAYWLHIERMRRAEASQLLDELEHIDGRVFERHISPLGPAGYPGALVVRWRDITPRKRAERSLMQSRARLSAVFDLALNAILLADDAGRYIDANPAACEMLGRTREQLLGCGVADVLALSASEAAAAWSAFLAQGSGNGLVGLRRADGQQRQVRFSAVARIQPGVHLSIMSDVTDEMRARQRELETAAQMELAMAHADIVFWSIDLVNDEVSSTSSHWLQQMLGYAAGDIAPGMRAWDALVHPDDFERRETAWQAHVSGRSPTYEAEFRLRHKDGRWIWLLARGRAIARDADGRALRVVGTRIDITRRKLTEQLLEQQAFTDGLTQTLNRRRFLELADVEVARARRHGQPLAMLMIDLDHFKAVNDRHGHAGGDTVLQAFVQTAQTVMRNSDLLGRVGGEEFAALLPQTDLDGAAALAQRLRSLVRAQPVALPAGNVTYTVSIGVAARRAGVDDGCTVESLMLAADTALYRAKGQGRDQVLLADAGSEAG